MKKIWKMERYRDASIQKKLTLSTWLVAIIPIMIIFAIVFFVFINVSVENSNASLRCFWTRRWKNWIRISHRHRRA